MTQPVFLLLQPPQQPPQPVRLVGGCWEVLQVVSQEACSLAWAVLQGQPGGSQASWVICLAVLLGLQAVFCLVARVSSRSLDSKHLVLHPTIIYTLLVYSFQMIKFQHFCSISPLVFISAKSFITCTLVNLKTYYLLFDINFIQKA